MASSAFSSILYFKRKGRRSARIRWQATIVWWCALGIFGFFVLNLIYQVTRKPGEIFAPISPVLSKSPESTWQSYGPLFEKHSTNIITPQFLAALAQVESDGNPVALTGWRWRWSWNPFEIYRPTSSALGMFQMTDGTFAEARKYCIRNHRVLTVGAWHDFGSCWFNSLYARTLPTHAAEMTAAYLHQRVVDTLAARGTAKISLSQKQRLAAVIHLCGLKRAEIFVAQGFRVTAKERCGSHNLQRYLTHIDLMKDRFTRLAAN